MTRPSDRLDGAKSGRDQSGRFAAGNPGGPGRPPRSTERVYLSVLADACPPDVWREVVQKAVDDAKAGDVRAREWLSSYLLGRPETAAKSLHQLAVEDAADSDPVGQDADLQRLIN